MSRIDIYETEADFIEFRFVDEASAKDAERCFPGDFVRTSDSVIDYRAKPAAIEEIRRRLKADGFEWTEAASGLTEDDMWPTWPGDDEPEAEGPLAP